MTSQNEKKSKWKAASVYLTAKYSLHWKYLFNIKGFISWQVKQISRRFCSFVHVFNFLWYFRISTIFYTWIYGAKDVSEHLFRKFLRNLSTYLHHNYRTVHCAQILEISNWNWNFACIFLIFCKTQKYMEESLKLTFLKLQSTKYW